MFLKEMLDGASTKGYVYEQAHAISNFIYWKEKDTHILTFLTSDLYWEHYFSWYQQFLYPFIQTIKFLNKSP